ncbi:IS21 family transposase, partial [Acidobacteria bacterium AH-259-D05]|nr:IS21 family transposase [Acidobacteria bacterium AH-259-D05]
RLLEENYQLVTSYMSVHRYVRKHLRECTRPVTVRLHSSSGEQAQVDFGFAGRMIDPEAGKLRKAWAFIMILSYSRHRFVRFVFRQDSETWLDCHIRAFDFFQGTTKLIVLDNLRDGVLKADIYDPTLNPAYAELERHFGFIADPAKVRMARHKGKVERSVPVVRQQLIAGRSYRDLEEANERALRWCREEIGLRKHGTTHRKPYEVFLAEELDTLQPLPAEPFEAAQWKECTIHWDCHLIFKKCYYSVSYPYRGEQVWVRADQKMLRVYLDHQLIKTHVRVRRAGSWQTDTQDYPPDKRAYLEQTPAYCRQGAAELGPHVGQYVAKILSDHAMRNLRKAQAVLRLSESYGAEVLDQACRRALSFGNLRYQSLKQILQKGLWKESCGPPRPSSLPLSAYRFARSGDYFVQTAGKESR